MFHIQRVVELHATTSVFLQFNMVSAPMRLPEENLRRFVLTQQMERQAQEYILMQTIRTYESQVNHGFVLFELYLSQCRNPLQTPGGPMSLSPMAGSQAQQVTHGFVLLK